LDFILLGIICAATGAVTLAIGGVACVIIFGVIISAACGIGIGAGCYAICEAGGYCGGPVMNYISYVTSCTPYGNGAVFFPENIAGAPDNGITYFYGQQNGDGGVIDGAMTDLSYGEIVLHNAWVDDVTHVYVYISQDNYNDWICIADGYMEQYSPADFDLGYFSNYFNYIAIAAWDPQMGSSLYIDSISATR
jgi:hypothetical protein